MMVCPVWRKNPMLKFWNLSKLTGMPGRWLSLSIVGLLGALLLVACGDTTAVTTPGPLPTLSATPTPIPATPLPNYAPTAFGATKVTAELVGGGSTFAEPLYAKWIAEYKKVAPNVKITYQGIGSGNGRSAFLGTPVAAINNVTPPARYDFAGSDATFSGQQFIDVTNRGEVVHLPTVLGAVVAAYKLDGYTSEIHLSGPTLAKIFMGEIKNWNDQLIVNDNSGATLPNKPITVVIRSRTSSSGTSEIFSRYLSAISSDFRDKVGPGGAPKWPSFGQLEGDGNEEVANVINGRDGAIGYIDQGIADQKTMRYASIRNQTGRFIKPTLESVTAAAQGVYIPDDFRIFVVNAEGENAYPIVGFTWLIVWKDFKNMPGATPEKAQALANFLWWGLNSGQSTLASGYAPLPATLIPRLQARFVNNDSSKVFLYDGKPLFTAPK
jgi:phosphate transport system substrate-binding protein